MIDKPTVFIIGAGANKPYGLPTGKELRKLICNKGSFLPIFDTFFPSGTRYRSMNNDELKEIVKEFSEDFKLSSTPSIDLYLSRNNQKYIDIGKIAIICTILNRERLSQFREDINDEDQDWYAYLFQRMSKELKTAESYSQFNLNKVTFITFNYDRSLEDFIYQSLFHSFSQANLERKIEVGNIKLGDLFPFKFLHVYGKIAPLPIEMVHPSIPYKWERVPAIHNLVDNIKTIYEYKQGQNPEIIKEIKDEIKNATRIFFLGFGFADENLDILGIPNEIYLDPIKKDVFGTALNISEKEKKAIIDKMYIYDPKLNLNQQQKEIHHRDFRARMNSNLRNIHCLKLLQDEL